VTTLLEISEAEAYGTKHQRAMLRLLRMDETKAPGIAVENCRRAFAMATEEPEKFGSLINDARIRRLFDCGALYFERAA
jgi:hypothetical protein